MKWLQGRGSAPRVKQAYEACAGLLQSTLRQFGVHNRFCPGAAARHRAGCYRYNMCGNGVRGRDLTCDLELRKLAL